MKRLYWLVPVVVVLITAAILLTQDSRKLAPEVDYTTLQGTTSNLASMKGKVVLVNFWATTCPGCVEEMANLGSLQNKFGPKGYETLSVAMQYDPQLYVQNFVSQQKMPFIITHDLSGNIAKAFGDVSLTPTSFLIDKQGRIVKRYLGTINKTELEKEITLLI
ncbi:peroxiredoxin family protein [Silvimonas soli]|uniref:peroxiredoxin family protein n=1 Tax=Silvimonas soli TaxID=2980100 RepID=UPI0024B35305|nr:TlpA disulfide reductase family protein [Silvimonas soli]